MRLRIVIFTLLISVSKFITADNCVDSCLLTSNLVSVTDSCSLLQATSQEFTKDSLHHKRVSKKEKRKKLIAAISAFPFPFGFVGAHRVILGTKPWVPVVYVATFGGCFGILPLIDFIVIICNNDVEKFENNPNVFMWTK
jgi:TM2 domain-containing membrane protein YozV